MSDNALISFSVLVPSMLKSALLLFFLLCTPSRFPSYLVDAHGMCEAVCTEDVKVATDCEIDFSYCLQDALGGDCAFAYTRDDLVAQAKTLCASDGTDIRHEWKGNKALYYILCALLAH